ncbi:MAG: histidine phosphatase family protein [Sphingomonadaceae bacterium]|nr:histidine phosphatase family protein [Sphingomonadaceae bacterium]
MKRLILLRHAKSGWDDPVKCDFDRPLNGRGRRGALAIGRWMREAGVRFDHAIASPAVRVAETLALVADSYGAPIAPEWERRVYLASNATLLEVVQEADDAVETLLMSGHNPGMEDLTLLLVPDTPGDVERAKVEEKFPTGALAEMCFDVAHWTDVDEGRGALLRFMRPRDLDPALGPDAE